MKIQMTLALAVGLALGAAAVQALHAQARPPVYYIAEVDVADLEGYVKEFVPRAVASSASYGGRTLAAGQGPKLIPVEGTPPKGRVVVMRWDSLEQLRAWRDSPQYKEDRKIADKYAASIRAFAIEALP